MATLTLTPSRVLHRPRRLDLRVVVGIFILLVATVGAVVAWNGATDSRPVLIATRDLASGATLTAADLAVTYLRADQTVYGVALPAGAEDQLIGKALAGPVYAHQILVRAQLSSRPSLGAGQVAFSIPVTADSAAGGRLQPGDSVRIYATTAKDTPSARTSVVVDRATVLNVGYDPQLGTAGPTESTQDSSGSAAPAAVRSLTLVVTEQEAQQLAFARWNGELDVALLPPVTTGSR